MAANGSRGFAGLPFEELSADLGSRARALASRRWFFACRPVPASLPERIPGVAPLPWQRLRERVALEPWRLVARDVAADGTTKLAVELGAGEDAATVETVLIPARSRSTVCLSSQAGCTRRCTFCATATLGFRRGLSAGEMLLQYALASALAPSEAPARNVVFMGMGEPLDNLDQVLAAIERLTEPGAPALGPTHVTVSTAGVLPGLRRFLRESSAQIALSLNATTDEQRDELMPHNRSWPIAALLDALRADAASGSDRRYFIEYVLIRGANDSDDDARRLAALLAGLPAHVNVIAHNPFPGSPWRSPPDESVQRFQRLLAAAGLRALVRAPRGRDVAAACGQLVARGA